MCVVHVVFEWSATGMIVRSGEVGCWCWRCCMMGCLVCVSPFMIMWGEVSIISVMFSPLLSLYGECHVIECALKSPSIQELWSMRRGVRWLVTMSLSSLLGCVRGGM